MGTLGSGNHYLEVQAVAEIFDTQWPKSYGLAEDDVVVTIHCGSRGLGHQIGTEFLKDMVVAASASGITLPDRELACAPINSDVGQRYLGAMRAAINCALANREILGHFSRRVFAHFFPGRELEPAVRRVAQYLQGRTTHGRRQAPPAVCSPQGRDARLRSRSRKSAGNASFSRPAGSDRRQHGNGFIYSGRRDFGRTESILVRLPWRRPRDVAPCGAQAMERTQDPG